MTTYKKLATFLIVTLLLGCGHTQQNEIKRIVFATGGCYGACPILAIDIDSTLTFKYHAVKYADTTGFFVGSVPSSLWDSLNTKLKNINYKKLDSKYEHSVDDLSTELYIYYGDKVKHIQGQSASLPDSVVTVYDWLLKSIKNLELTQSRDSLIFPTAIEKPLPLPSIPEKFKFLPPAAEYR